MDIPQSRSRTRLFVILSVVLTDILLFILIPYLDDISPGTLHNPGAGIIALFVSVALSVILLIALILLGFVKKRRTFFMAAVLHLVLWVIYLLVLFNITW